MSRSVSAPSSVTNTSPCWNGLIVPGSTFRYGSNFCTWTLRPRALRSRPSEAATMPFPRPETTPPVTGMRFAGRRQARSAERGARSSRALFWSRFKRDRLALTSAIFLVFVIVGCFAGLPVAEHFLGHGPNDIFPLAAAINGYPAGPWSHVPNSHGVPVVTPETPRTLFILGADGQLGHDEFLRLLAGGQTSLEIGVGAALLAILIGVTVGLLAGYYGRVIDT